MVLVAVGFEAGVHSVEEAGEGVAVPLLEAVAVQSNPNAAALIGEDSEFVDEVGVVEMTV